MTVSKFVASAAIKSARPTKSVRARARRRFCRLLRGKMARCWLVAATSGTTGQSSSRSRFDDAGRASRRQKRRPRSQAGEIKLLPAANLKSRRKQRFSHPVRATVDQRVQIVGKADTDRQQLLASRLIENVERQHAHQFFTAAHGDDDRRRGAKMARPRQQPVGPLKWRGNRVTRPQCHPLRQ